MGANRPCGFAKAECVIEVGFIVYQGMLSTYQGIN